MLDTPRPKSSNTVISNALVDYPIYNQDVRLSSQHYGRASYTDIWPEIVGRQIYGTRRTRTSYLDSNLTSSCQRFSATTRIKPGAPPLTHLIAPRNCKVAGPAHGIGVLLNRTARKCGSSSVAIISGQTMSKQPGTSREIRAAWSDRIESRHALQKE